MGGDHLMYHTMWCFRQTSAAVFVRCPLSQHENVFRRCTPVGRFFGNPARLAVLHVEL